MIISLQPSEVISLWSAKYGYTLSDVKEPDRNIQIRVARQVLSYCLWKYAVMSYTAIGLLIDQTHCNISHSVKKVIDTYRNDREYKGLLNALLAELDENTGRVNNDTLNVKITRSDIINMIPDISEEQMTLPMTQLWEQYKVFCITKLSESKPNRSFQSPVLTSAI